MKRLKPMFSYYGAKFRLSPKYPSPIESTIIEPFAGSACYSLLHYHQDVKLYDKYEKICVLWEYLINVSETEIRSLPLLERGEEIPLNLPDGARYLIGFWSNKAGVRPRLTMTNYKNLEVGFWSASIRERIASQVSHIRHWTIEQACYSEIPNIQAHYFVDPPYQDKGQYYAHNKIDFNHLGEWCKTRKGSVVVCENEGADWLPFEPFQTTKGLKKQSKEVIYHN